MKQIKIFSNFFLISIEVFSLLFLLRGLVYAGCHCDCDYGGPVDRCLECNRCDDPPGSGYQDCFWSESCPGGGCFTPETKISTPEGEKEIQNIKEGEVVKSFDSETGEIKESTVSDVHKRQVQGYYILKTESGREIKVTGEHPILAVKADKSKTRSLRTFLENIWEKVVSLVR